MKNIQFVFISFLFIFSTSLFAQPGSDCANAETVTDISGFNCPASTNTVAASTTDNYTPTACVTGVEDTWFSWVAEDGAGTITVVASQTGFAPDVTILTGSCGSLSQIACLAGLSVNDTFTITLGGFVSGQTYYLAVSSNSNSTAGTIGVCIENELGDNCADAIDLPVGVTMSRSTNSTTTINFGAGSTFGVPCAGGTGAERWFKVQIPTGCFDYAINVTQTGGGTGNMNLFAFQTTDCFTYGPVGGGNCGVNPTQNIIGATGPDSFYVKVSAESGIADFDILVTQTGPNSIPTFDNCATPGPLTAGDGIENGGGMADAYNATLSCASTVSNFEGSTVPCPGTAFNNEDESVINFGTCQVLSLISLACGSGSTENSVYFSFIAPSTNTYKVWIGNQVCSSSDGVQFFITDVLNCSDAFFTSTNTLLTTTGGAGCNSISSTGTKELEFAFTAATTYYIVADGFAGDQCTFDILITLATQPDPFPVSLLYFDGEYKGDHNLLEWATASEVNTKEFVIERSADGLDFENIGKNDAFGNSNQVVNYDFQDHDPLSGVNYYRLRQVDLDGEIHYSDIIQIQSPRLEDGFKLYPNPATDQLYLKVTEATKVKFEIYDLQGKLLLSKNIDATAEDVAKIAIGYLTSGVYVYKLWLGNAKSSRTGKLVKK